VEITEQELEERMSDSNSGGGVAGRNTPVHLWIVGVLSLLWNSVGAFDYLATQLGLEFYMSQFTEQQLAYFTSFPPWAVAGWAFGVWGAFVGSIALLLRKKWAFHAFAVSIAGLFVSTIYSFGLSDGAEIAGVGGMVFNAVIWIVAILLLLYSRAQTKSGVLS
jgi:hypothetical protein